MSAQFKVIIIGAGVSGLTLGHALHHAGIDFVILEKGSQVAFDGGASIGLFPHGLRILDQMGMYEDIQEITEPIGLTSHRYCSGKAFSRSGFARHIEERHGYPITFFEREDLLKVLYNKFPDKTKIHTSKNVVDIQSEPLGVTVTTRDGSVYRGDIVVGADGVHSTVRKFMWEIMERKEPGSSKVQKDSMYADYYCAFGVSVYESDDPEFITGRGHVVYDERRSGVFINSTRNKNFWFLILKFDERKFYPNVPRFTAEDTEAAVTKNFDMRVTERTSVEDLWRMRTKCLVASLEEVVFDNWHVDRMVLLGDAAHKLTPNSGQGGNSAIEGAAVLANLLYEAKTASSKEFSLEPAAIRDIFERYQLARKSRVTDVFKTAAFVTRLQAQDSNMFKMISKFVTPYLGDDFETNLTSDVIMGAPILQFMEKKGREGTVPWEGWASSTTTKTGGKTFYAAVINYVPYMLLAAFGIWKLWGIAMSNSSAVTSSAGFQQLPLGNMRDSRTLNPINDLVWITNFLSGSGRADSWAVLNCYLNILPVGAIIAVESFRANNFKTFSAAPWLIAIAFQLGNLAVGGLLYFASFAIENSLSNIRSVRPEGNRVPMRNARSLAPALLISCLIPLVLATNIPLPLWPNSHGDSVDLLIRCIRVFSLAPWLLSVSLAQLRFGGNSQEKMIGYQDLPHLRKAFLLSAFISMISSFCSKYRLVFANSNALSGGPWILGLVGCHHLGQSLQRDYTLFTILSLIWVYSNFILTFKAENQTALNKFKLVGTMLAASVLLGPGATTALLWIWREDSTRIRHAA